MIVSIKNLIGKLEEKIKKLSQKMFKMKEFSLNGNFFKRSEVRQKRELNNPNFPKGEVNI